MIDFLRRHDERTQHIQGDGFNPYCVGCNLRSRIIIQIAHYVEDTLSAHSLKNIVPICQRTFFRLAFYRFP